MQHYIMEPSVPGVFGDDRLVVVHPFAVPAVACPRCEETWMDYGPIPVVCPIGARSTLLQCKSPLELNLHNDVLLDLALKGLNFNELRAGNLLMPGYCYGDLDPGDLNWTWLPNTLLVSNDVKLAFEASGLRGLSFFRLAVLKDKSDSPAMAKRLCLEEPSSNFWEIVPPYVFNEPEIKARHIECTECRSIDGKKVHGELVTEVVNRFDLVRYKGLKKFVVSERFKEFVIAQSFANAKFTKVFAP